MSGWDIILSIGYAAFVVGLYVWVFSQQERDD